MPMYEPEETTENHDHEANEAPAVSPLSFVPRKVFFTRGKGIHREKLQSFELALRAAGIARLNIVSVSSIYPPNCRIIGTKQGLSLVQPGQVTFVVMARADTNEPNRLIAASIGLATPADKNHFGYLSEHHGYGQTARRAGDYAEDLAATMLATTLGIEFDESVHWDERKELWKINNQIYKTANVTQSAIGDKRGYWTTVVAAAVFVP